MKRTGLVLAALLGLVACGGDDGDGGGSSGGGSYGAIANAIAMPTGTVDMDTAPAIAEQFEQISSNGSGGERFEQAGAGAQTIQCTAGGTQTVSGSGNQSGGMGTVVFNDCCMEATCCISGDATTYYSTGGTSDYTYCYQYDVTATCGGSASTVNYEGCLGGAGGWTYVVRVDGETFAVSGNYSGGNGTLTISGENGDYTCTYSNGTGSCTGDGSFSF
jgi:hypothetical protein